MLFEALTGRVPFEGKLYKILIDKQRYDAPRARELSPNIPEDLENAMIVSFDSSSRETRNVGTG